MIVVGIAQLSAGPGAKGGHRQSGLLLPLDEQRARPRVHEHEVQQVAPGIGQARPAVDGLTCPIPGEDVTAVAGIALLAAASRLLPRPR